MKILVVDDSFFIQKMLVKALKSNLPDAEIFTAYDGVSGLSSWKENTPDLTITDLLMPNMNGHQLIIEILKLNSKANLVVLSADIQKTVKEEINALGILSFINKPLNDEKVAEICSIIKEATLNA